MTIKEIHARAGSLSGYVGYFLLLFFWNLLNNIYASLRTALPENSVVPLISVLGEFIIGSLLAAGVFGGIHQKQQTQEISSASAFIRGIKLYFGRILGAFLLYTLIYLLILPLASLISVGLRRNPDRQTAWFLRLLFVPLSAFNLFWTTSIVVERKIFRGMVLAVKTLFNPYALIIGILWGAISFASSAIIETLGGQTTYAINALLAVALAAAKIVAVAYALTRSISYPGEQSWKNQRRRQSPSNLQRLLLMTNW